MNPQEITNKTSSEIVRLWKLYSKRLSLEMSKGVTPYNLVLKKNVTFKKEEVDRLSNLIDQSYKEVNLKFVRQLKGKKTVQTVSLSNIKENNIIYKSFKDNRDAHIYYFKKYPSYVRHELEKHLIRSTKSVTFHGPKVAKAAHEVAMMQKKVIKHLEKNKTLAEDIARRHANFIARDQLGKFTASIHEAQAQFVGAEKYIWKTSMDQRVRPEHREREGNVYYYNNPPADGNPGIPYRCRCYAAAIVTFE